MEKVIPYVEPQTIRGIPGPIWAQRLSVWLLGSYGVGLEESTHATCSNLDEVPGRLKGQLGDAGRSVAVEGAGL